MQSIVFVSELPWERPAKIALALRKVGISPFLVYVRNPNNFDLSEYFEHSIQAQSAEEALAIVHRLRPGLVHLFSYGADQISYFLLENRPPCPVIYDYKDCFENVVNPPHTDLWLEVQRRMVLMADGLCCRDLQLWNYCRVNGLRPRGKRTLFLDYCWGGNQEPVRPRRDGEVHTVIAGNFSIEKLSPAALDTGYLHTARLLALNGVHVHIYPRWHFSYITEQEQLQDYIDLTQQSPYVHLYDPVPMNRFVEEMSQYDFGLGILQGALFDEIGVHSTSHGHERHGMATRWFDYIEAGLDVLASPELHFMYRVVRNAGVAHPARAQDFLRGDIKQRLLAQMHNHKDLRIQAARQRLSIHRHIDHLLRFYRSL